MIHAGPRLVACRKAGADDRRDVRPAPIHADDEPPSRAAADTAIGELRELAFSPVLHAGAGAAVLLGANVLSVYKPRGLTPYGWRWEDEQRRKQLERRAKPAA